MDHTASAVQAGDGGQARVPVRGGWWVRERARGLPAAYVPHDGDSPGGERPVLPVARSVVKRAADIGGALVLMLLSAPLVAMIAIAIRLDSRGPIVFRQPRCGFRGRPFTCLKFRSMKMDAAEDRHRDYVRDLIQGEEKANSNGAYKLEEDDRVTRVGAWLRKTSLDELPQLWNVLKGEMTLVGPRPPLPYEVELYDARQWQRLECKPGLTGLWQVSGRNQLSYRSMCELDLQYIANWSHSLDMRILARTIPVVLRNTGSAQ